MNNTHIDEDEIDLKEVFRTLSRYKYMIISLVLLFTIAAGVFAYFKPNIYQASSSIEVTADRRAGNPTDVLSMAMEGSAVNIDTEIEIVKSVSLAEKALKHVDMTHHYYTTRRYKKVELYKGSPFEVGMLKGYGIGFELFPISDKHYRLFVDKAKDENKNEWHYDKILSYGKEIVNEHFHLNVIKTGEMKDESYAFTVIDPEQAGRVVRENVSVSQPSKFASVLSISYTDNVALRTQEFTNALADAYVARSINKKTKEADIKLKFINAQMKRINENLKRSATKLEEFKRSSNTVDLSAKAEQILRQMNTFETQLTNISIQQKILDTLYKEIKSGDNIESISLDSMDQSAVQTSLSRMIQDLQQAIVQKRILRQDYTEVYPGVRRLKNKIAELKTIIISNIKSLAENITEKQKLLENSIAEQQKLLNTLPADQKIYGELERRFAVNEKIYSYLLEKQSETAIVKASTVSKNSIIDRAFYPEAPIKPKRKLIVLVGMILGLIVGIALAFLRAFLDDRIKTEEEISHATGVPVLGVIPHIKKDEDDIKVFNAPKSSLAESFRNLRTNLQFMTREGEGAYVIAVSSTVGGEGKTTVSTNLAAIMSMSGKKTVIINCDMRKPTLHKKFSLPNKEGVSNLLSNTALLDETIRKTKYENLDVITSGPVPPNPSELIQGKHMEKLIDALKKRYDVIVIDTPPVGLVTDARALMHYADATVYIMRSEYSKKAYFKMVNKLAEEEISNFSILLNDLKMEHAGYGYYGYGYYEEDGK